MNWTPGPWRVQGEDTEAKWPNLSVGTDEFEVALVWVDPTGEQPSEAAD